MTFSDLQKELKGDLFTDDLQRILYATDASSYRELPLAVARPGDKEDVRKIISFARSIKSSVIPRGAGTSLAGQVVGPGIVVDISRYMNHILEFNRSERWIIVEPGVILAELNKFLELHGLQFGPETSTANRCCMAGMVGNNSCGLHSLIYGSVRDHIIEMDVILSDGSEVTFKGLTGEEFHHKCDGNPGTLETLIYRNIRDILSDPANREEIRKELGQLIPVLFYDPALKMYRAGCSVLECPCNESGICSSRISLDTFKEVSHEYDGDNCVKMVCG